MTWTCMASSETEPLLFNKDVIEVAGEILDFLLSFRQTLQNRLNSDSLWKWMMTQSRVQKQPLRVGH